MANVAVVFHSGYGHTKKQAEAVAAGAALAAGAKVDLIPIDAEGNLPADGWDKLNAAHAPTYMGMASWQFKKFADASSKIWFTLGWKDKLAAGFTNSASLNGDKHSTLHYFFTLAMQQGMLWAGTAMMPSSTKAAVRNDVNSLGSFAGAMAATPSDASAEEVNAGDMETAKLFGQRIAEQAARISK
jgi:NAD(P)H dehydrogenase (quinone)